MAVRWCSVRPRKSDSHFKANMICGLTRNQRRYKPDVQVNSLFLTYRSLRRRSPLFGTTTRCGYTRRSRASEPQRHSFSRQHRWIRHTWSRMVESPKPGNLGKRALTQTIHQTFGNAFLVAVSAWPGPNWAILHRYKSSNGHGTSEDHIESCRPQACWGVLWVVG